MSSRFVEITNVVVVTYICQTRNQDYISVVVESHIMIDSSNIDGLKFNFSRDLVYFWKSSGDEGF